MAIQHRDIPDAQLHEPKGIVTALARKVYVSNGAGSGVWSSVGAGALEGIGADNSTSGLKLVTNSSNGFVFARDAAYGALAITNNSVNFPMTAVVDTTFNTPAQFSLLTGVGAPWASETLFGITSGANSLTVPVTGVYELDFWMGIKGFPSNTAKIAFRYLVNGSSYSTRKPTIKSNSVGDNAMVAASGLVTLAAGSLVQIVVASDTTGNLLIGDANLTLKLLRQTA